MPPRIRRRRASRRPNRPGSRPASASSRLHRLPDRPQSLPAGPNQTVSLGSKVFLDGSHSTDVDGNPLTYQWSLVGLPSGSLATLTGANTVSPSFTVDKPGTYQIRLIVNDGVNDSSPAFVTVTTQNTPPVAVS